MEEFYNSRTVWLLNFERIKILKKSILFEIGNVVWRKNRPVNIYILDLRETWQRRFETRYEHEYYLLVSVSLMDLSTVRRKELNGWHNYKPEHQANEYH